MKLRILISFVALVIGSLIVLTSLASAQQVRSSSGDAGQKSLYWDRPIGPDHSLYWLAMANDKLSLEVADPVQRIHLQIEYAHERLGYSKDLMEQDPALASSTLIKAEKYLLRAGQEYLALDKPPAPLAKLLIKAFDYHQTQLETLFDQVPQDQRAPLEQLREEHKVLVTQLTAFTTN